MAGLHIFFDTEGVGGGNMSRFNLAALAFLIIIFINPVTSLAGPRQDARKECKTPTTKACRKVCKKKGWKHNTTTVLNTCRKSKASVETYKMGKRFYDQGNHKDALPFFQQANKLWPAPIYLYSMARCHEALGQYKDAITNYNRYLDSKPMNAADTQMRIKELQAKIEAAKPKPVVKPKPDPPKPKPRPATQPVVQPKPDPPKPKPKPLPLPKTSRFKRNLGISGMVVGGLAALAGGGCLIASSQKNSDIKKWLEDGGPYNQQIQDDEALAKRLETGGIISAATGGAMAITGAILFYLHHKEQSAAARRAAQLLPTFTPTPNGGFASWKIRF